jgi:hypothetical protein
MEENSKQYVSLNSLKEYQTSPFVEALINSGILIPKKRIEKQEELFTNETTGETISLPTTTIGTGYYFKDPRTFVKFFSCEDCFKQIANLTKPASYLFWSIVEDISNCPKGQKVQFRDMVRLSFDKYHKFSGTNSKTSYYKAIIELEKKEFIAKFASDTYYININKFANGDVSKFIEKYLDPEDEYYKTNRRTV